MPKRIGRRGKRPLRVGIGALVSLLGELGDTGTLGGTRETRSEVRKKSVKAGMTRSIDTTKFLFPFRIVNVFWELEREMTRKGPS